jgi:HEAT repeat protein
MSDSNLGDLEQTESAGTTGDDATEPGFLSVEEKSTTPTPAASPVPPTSSPDEGQTTSAARSTGRMGTVEHLAARRVYPALDVTTPALKQQLAEMRMELTDMLTSLRWGERSATEIAERLIPLLNLGPLPQWQPVLIPFLLEIDRAGNLVPVWVKIIEHGDPPDLPPDANPAETELGRARRYAILMLGNYKYVALEDNTVPISNVTKLLGTLALDPNTSLYATQSLVKQGTTAAIQALIEALKEAEGWAKVDIIEACISLNLTRFYDLLLAAGLDRVSGLESYVATPLYRTIGLEPFLRQQNKGSGRLAQQAALIFAQVLQDSMVPPKAGTETLPVVFEQSLPAMAHALFDGARKLPTWQHTFAVHRLGIFLGRYWSDISRNTLTDVRIVEPVYAVLPLMPEIERWMNSAGRECMLQALTEEAEPPLPIIRVLGELRETRATSALLNLLERRQVVTDREQARYVGTLCDTLGRLGDRRAVSPMLQLLALSVAIEPRASLPKRRENLAPDDVYVAGSIIYGAVVRACSLLGERDTLTEALRATDDFDPYVRVQGIEAIKRLDASAEDLRSLLTARERLNDPADAVVRAASQLLVQYRDKESIPRLRALVSARPQLAPALTEALRQLER